MQRAWILAIVGGAVMLALIGAAVALLGKGGGEGEEPVAAVVQQPTVEDAAEQAAYETRNVLVAAAVLEKGHLISVGDWVEEEKSEEGLPLDVLRVRNAEGLAGAALKQLLEPGDILRESLVVRPGARGFVSLLLAPGHRAVGVNVTQATRDAGLVDPGDRVDVVFTAIASHGEGISGPGVEALPDNVTGSKLTRMLMEDVRVLAIDRFVHDASSENEPREQAASFGVATLEVPTAQVPVLVHAERTGELSLVVRASRTGSDTQRRATAVHTQELLLPGVSAKRPPLEAVHEVKIIRGAGGEERKVFPGLGEAGE